jgi:hypothetical protein
MLLAATPSSSSKTKRYFASYRDFRVYKLVYMSSPSKNSVDPDIDPSRIPSFVDEESAWWTR